jgi:putative transposon-encoded protein
MRIAAAVTRRKEELRAALEQRVWEFAASCRVGVSKRVVSQEVSVCVDVAGTFLTAFVLSRSITEQQAGAAIERWQEGEMQCLQCLQRLHASLWP